MIKTPPKNYIIGDRVIDVNDMKNGIHLLGTVCVRPAEHHHFNNDFTWVMWDNNSFADWYYTKYLFKVYGVSSD